MTNDASELIGKNAGDWKILEKRLKTSDDDSGAFSSCYLVENVNTQKKAFLKALNLHYALQARPDTSGASWLDIIQDLTTKFKYETDILKLCGEQKMDRVVIAIDSGSIDADPIPIPYLIFEQANSSLKNVSDERWESLVWKLRAFHGILIGAAQLHNAKIVHQDIKPSNILVFGENVSKISDLGCATQQGNLSGHDSGDLRYAPIELWYGYVPSEWNIRRLGADIFMLGGLLCYIICDSNYLSLLCNKIPEEFHFSNGCSFEDASAHLKNKHFDILQEITENADLPQEIKNELITILDELCFPIPEQRGNRNYKMKGYGQFNLRPYISKIDRLSKTIKWCKK